MATKNIVPRADGEGSLGRAAKQWGDAQIKKINGKTPSEFVAAETPKEHALDAHTAVTLAELNAIISDATIPSDAAATTSAAGLMSASDKVKVDGVPPIAEGDAGKLVAVKIDESGYETVAPTTLPTASADTLGGVKVGANLSIADGVLSATGGLTEDQVRNLIIVWA